MNNQLSIQKNMLRAEARKQRNAFAAFNRPSSWRPLAHSLGAAIAGGSMVASYRPKGSEVDPAMLEDWADELGARICYPRIDADGAMRFYAMGPQGCWATAEQGFEEPVGDVVRSDPNIVFVPLLAFDRTGTRLGQGGGHYDRALAGLPDALKIGIAWSVQEMADLPRGPWDIPLDIVITEREWIVTS